MGNVFYYALGTGIACGIWTYIGGLLNGLNPDLFLVWLGFAGCTSFFMAGAGKKGFIRSTASNIVGVLIGCTVIFLSSLVPENATLWFSAIITGFFSFVIPYLVHIGLFKIAGCTFLGGFCTFAIGPNWKMLILCLVLGNLLGVCCDYLGNFLAKKFAKPGKEWVILDFHDKDKLD